MKIRLNKKNRSHRYDINRPRQRQGHKYTKYKKCLGIIMIINVSCIALSKLFQTIEKKHFFPYLTEKGKEINNVVKVANKTHIYVKIYNTYTPIYT